MSKQTILVYDPLNSPWMHKLGQTCAVQKLRFRRVEAADLGVKVGTLAAGLVPAEPPAAVPPIGEPMLVLCNLGDKQLDRVLQAMRKAGVPMTTLKCILTPHNAGWTFRELYEEISKERVAITSGQGPVDHDEA